VTSANNPGRVSIREVAERAGVASSSVSRVLSGHPDVSEDMKARVLSAVAQLRYAPDPFAQSLRRQTSMSVGFAASNISNPILTETMIGAERVLRRHGYSMLMTDAEGTVELDIENIETLRRRRVDGLLLSVTDEQQSDVRQLLSDIDVPVVLVDRDVPTGLAIPRVYFDHASGMASAAQRLWELGHRSVVVISGGPRLPARERLAGIQSVFQTRGGTFLVIEKPFTVEHGSEAIAEVLAMRPRPTAVVAAGNLYTRGALVELRKRGVAIGRDLSLVGCDDITIAQLHQPAVAIVSREPRRAGEVAARLLLAHLDGSDAPTETELRLPTLFVDAPSVAEPNTKR
jgi:LacI family transcriptional regulator, galactose operon repressor